VRALGLKSFAEWSDYSKSGKRPNDIPGNPYRIYANAGWLGWGDWVGTGRIADQLRQYRSFKDARAFVRRLGLKSSTEWFDYGKCGKKPADIPAYPGLVYEKSGWAGYGDWLGTGTTAPQLREYRSFKKARAFARNLGLKSRDEWYDYCKSGKKPADIPANPHTTYAEAGWSGMGDWLGTGTIASHLREYRSFKDARAFVRRLDLKSQTEWKEYCKSGKKPADIPARPHTTYAEAGWSGMGDWLGTGTTAPQLREYRSFKNARAFVRRLGLKSQTDWFDYSKSGKRANDIPGNPNKTYAEAGWAGYGDWLGTGTIAPRLQEYRSFKDARAFVRRLGLKSEHEWRDYVRSGKKPADIPADPRGTYAKAGWAGSGDWLGTGTVVARLRQYRSFKKARAFARNLGLKSHGEWSDYCKSGKKPADIPAAPDQLYAEAGWVGMGDWLGTGRRRYGTDWPPFKNARAFVRRLGLKNYAEWSEYCRSGKKPADIPAAPYEVYAEAGWVGMGDWLGTGVVARGQYRDFKKARAFARNLGLKSRDEWYDYCKSGKKPADIPANPNQTYGEAGWSGVGDWLGTGAVATRSRQYRSFKKARAFVHALGLKSSNEWKDYCKSGKKPAEIPAVPHRTYAGDGWSGFGDWLGYARNHSGMRAQSGAAVKVQR
jgi:hypothetical protein